MKPAHIVPIEAFCGEDAQDTADVRQMARDAGAYLSSFNWCGSISESYVGIALPGVVGVFLFKIVPRGSADERIWVVIGDLPTAYIAFENAPNAACALNGYIFEMQRWVDAVRQKKATSELIPVNAPETLESAVELESRLNFLRDKLLIYYVEDLKECG